MSPEVAHVPGREPTQVSPAVTTVVITRDRLADLLVSVPRHRGPVIVVDNGSRDGTVAALRSLGRPGLTVVPLGRNLGAQARNVGVELARTPLVAFADDDSWWAPGALDHAAAAMATHRRLGLLTGRVLVGPEERLDPVCELMAASPLGSPCAPDAGLPGPEVLGFIACGAVVRREAFLQAGGFDDVVVFPGEEERLALDLATHGWFSCYVPDVVAHHHPSSSREISDVRAALITRNWLLTALMRRPWPIVAARMAHALRSGPAGRRGVATMLPRAAAALRHRRVVPPAVEARVRLVEVVGSRPEPDRTSSPAASHT
jgi:GT2 family glycosyltransferase